MRRGRNSEAADRRDGGQRQAMLSPAQLADYLGVPVKTLYDWRWKGEGPPGYRVGRHVRYRIQDVEAWLEQHADRRGRH